jgi:tetratricopeptide (TPR) repeat protein
MKKILIVLLILLGSTAFADVANEAKLEYNRGVDYCKIGQYDRSMAAFRRAIELDSNYVDAYYNLGSILEYLHQDDAALAVFKQIIVRKPDDYESLYKAAKLSSKLGQPDKAKSYLSLIPKDSSVYSDAQELLVTLPEDKVEQVQPEIPKFSQTNEMYNNIPSPTGIATDKNGNVFIASFSDNMIYKITPDGKKIIFVKDAKINGPIAMVSDSAGNLYVSNYNSDNVIKITPTGTIFVQISNIQKPYGISIADGMLFVSSQGTNSVLRYKL